MKTATKVLFLLAMVALWVWTPFVVYDRLDRASLSSGRVTRFNDSTLPTLRIAVMEHPTVFYDDPSGAKAGLEHDLVNAFARTRRSNVEWKTFANPDEARRALLRGEVDMVAAGAHAAGLAATEVATKTRYHESAWILLHTPTKFEPRSMQDLLPKRVIVSARIYSHPAFAEFRKRNANIAYELDAASDDEALIAAVGDDEVPYAIVEEDTFNASRHIYYDTRRAFVVQPSVQRAWIFGVDNLALREEADAFLARLAREGQIARVLDRYFGFPTTRKQQEFEIFTERVGTLLPRYRKWFHEAQERYGIEWRLLAAVAYQESHWNADATSETGVRGIMQFTEDTARRFGVDRLDPYSSIIGGARYINELKANGLAARIAEPDKTWLALASYNIGLGHVENARILTQRSRRNPDVWVDVRRHLLLLARPDVAAGFSLGPCRCGMPVDFVESVRAYYDVLLRLEAPHQPRLRIQTS